MLFVFCISFQSTLTKEQKPQPGAFLMSVARPFLMLFCYRKQQAPAYFESLGSSNSVMNLHDVNIFLQSCSPNSLGFPICFSKKILTRTIVWAHRFETVFMILCKQAVITGQTGLWWSAQCPRRNEGFFCAGDCSKCTRDCSAWVGYKLTLNPCLTLLLFPVCVMDEEESKRKYPK